ncbi:MAG: monovalent cation/H(+) antiporter subunit G [Rhodospirillaceae bacterium]|nr:monovalent cation/H(+) antiporter subunit G [Rhodospirillaceae bacterium]
MDAFIYLLSWALLVGGGFFCVVGALGLLRMPDAFTRLHAASVIDTLGVGMIVAGLMVQSGLTLTTARLGIILLLVFFTSPVASHAIARSMRHRNVKPVLSEDRTGEGG